MLFLFPKSSAINKVWFYSQEKKPMLSFSKIWFRSFLLIIQGTLKYLASLVSISYNCISMLVEGVCGDILWVSTPSETTYYPFFLQWFLGGRKWAFMQKTPSSGAPEAEQEQEHVLGGHELLTNLGPNSNFKCNPEHVPVSTPEPHLHIANTWPFLCSGIWGLQSHWAVVPLR